MLYFLIKSQIPFVHIRSLLYESYNVLEHATLHWPGAHRARPITKRPNSMFSVPKIHCTPFSSPCISVTLTLFMSGCAYNGGSMIHGNSGPSALSNLITGVRLIHPGDQGPARSAQSQLKVDKSQNGLAGNTGKLGNKSDCLMALRTRDKTDCCLCFEWSPCTLRSNWDRKLSLILGLEKRSPVDLLGEQKHSYDLGA